MNNSPAKILYQTYSEFKNFGGQYPEIKTFQENFEKEFRPYLPLEHQATIIELGSGPGFLLKWLQSIGYQNSFGIELDPQQVDWAKANDVKNIQTGDCLEFIKTLPDNSVDLILAIDLFEHLTFNELTALLITAQSKLKTNGQILARTPNTESPFFGLYQFGDLTHQLAFNRLSFKQLAASFKFSSVNFRECHQKHSPVFSLKPTNLKNWLQYKLYQLAWYLIKNILLLDKKAILTRNLITIFQK